MTRSYCRLWIQANSVSSYHVHKVSPAYTLGLVDFSSTKAWWAPIGLIVKQICTSRRCCFSCFPTHIPLSHPDTIKFHWLQGTRLIRFINCIENPTFHDLPWYAHTLLSSDPDQTNVITLFWIPIPIQPFFIPISVCKLIPVLYLLLPKPTSLLLLQKFESWL